IEKYCRYHRDHDHDTEECKQLKNQIEDLIRKGHLRTYVDRDAPQGRREQRREEAPRLREAVPCCTTSPSQQKAEKGWRRGGDVLLEADYEGVRLPHDDPVVVTLQVALFTMKRILIDSGSSVDILYKHAFDQLRIPADQLKPVKTPLVGFAGEMVHPLGSIDLSVVAGTPPPTHVEMTFLVVDTPSTYNAIIGRPWLNLLEA
ncbi:LOW QUALITY PROTEIN: hypothetical protein CFOL_v3_24062, partial [Cephalotus follicularis]